MKPEILHHKILFLNVAFVDITVLQVSTSRNVYFNSKL